MAKNQTRTLLIAGGALIVGGAVVYVLTRTAKAKPLPPPPPADVIVHIDEQNRFRIVQTVRGFEVEFPITGEWMRLGTVQAPVVAPTVEKAIQIALEELETPPPQNGDDNGNGNNERQLIQTYENMGVLIHVLYNPQTKKYELARGPWPLDPQRTVLSPAMYKDEAKAHQVARASIGLGEAGIPVSYTSTESYEGPNNDGYLFAIFENEAPTGLFTYAIGSIPHDEAQFVDILAMSQGQPLWELPPGKVAVDTGRVTEDGARASLKKALGL